MTYLIPKSTASNNAFFITRIFNNKKMVKKSISTSLKIAAIGLSVCKFAIAGSNFTIAPTAGTTLPTTMAIGSIAYACYTVTNNTSITLPRPSNLPYHIVGLPANALVSQDTSGHQCPNTFPPCQENITLNSKASCNLQLNITGKVNSSFALCSGTSCTTAAVPLNVSVSYNQAPFYSFGGSPDGARPLAGLIQGTDGNFYGTTLNGGTGEFGTVFKITPAGIEAFLYSFASIPDGAFPFSALIQGTDGNFYGTTANGGANGQGAVLKITPDGSETIFYSFGQSPDGSGPYAALIQGTDGSFYGTTANGGVYGLGTVFKISPAGVETILHSFSGNPDGIEPYSSLIQGANGDIYGTTLRGGIADGGTVFKISPAGVETILHSFSGNPDGESPQSSLIQGTDGNFYGTTQSGGTSGLGTVFQITPTGIETILHSFGGSPDGGLPFAALIQGTDGNFYGTTYNGGIYGLGTVFQITPTGVETILYNFGAILNDGSNPRAPLIVGSNGNFYGTTTAGGVNNSGTVFEVKGG